MNPNYNDSYARNDNGEDFSCRAQILLKGLFSFDGFVKNGLFR